MSIKLFRQLSLTAAISAIGFEGRDDSTKIKVKSYIFIDFLN